MQEPSSSRLLSILRGQGKLWFATLAMGAAVFMLAPSMPHSFVQTEAQALRSFGGLVAQLAGTFAGFVITFIALIFALPDRPVLRDMRSSGHFLELCANLFSCVIFFLVIMLVAAILSIAADPITFFRILISMSPGIAFMVFQCAVRLAITVFVVAKPS